MVAWMEAQIFAMSMRQKTTGYELFIKKTAE